MNNYYNSIFDDKYLKNYYNYYNYHMSTIPTLKDFRLKQPKAHTKCQQHRQETGKYYHTKEWRLLRQCHMQEHPLDELALLDDKIVSAVEVHHCVKWFDQVNDFMRKTILLDDDNIVSVSKQMHHDIHYAPDKLTQALKDFLKKKKEDLYAKYLLNGIIINVSEDLNFEKNG